MDEQELTEVFGRAVGGASPDLGRLITGAESEGRSIRRRRRAVTGGAVAAVAALALGGALLLAPGGPADTLPAGPPGLAAPTDPDTVPLTGRTADLILADLLRPWKFDLQDFTGNERDLSTYREVQGRLLAKTPAGRVEFTVRVVSDLGATTDLWDLTRPCDYMVAGADTTGASCQRQDQEGGKYLVFHTLPGAGGTTLRAFLVRPDRSGVVVTERWSPTGRTPEPTAGKTLPLQVSELGKLAMGSGWSERVDTAQAARAESVITPYAREAALPPGVDRSTGTAGPGSGCGPGGTTVGSVGDTPSSGGC
ncbi:hypothetical protein [Kitasatospora camelliae]|uniref:Uncharacterized protein n=1 Tax=Kitasatospora camelliae TaxID=3156397 RepID=A0AAU8JWG7_9ACTN